MGIKIVFALGAEAPTKEFPVQHWNMVAILQVNVIDVEVFIALGTRFYKPFILPVETV